MAASGPRYAPADPTLPKPWRGLVDGNTGYLYFWNPVTNVTQYERPLAAPVPPVSSAVTHDNRHNGGGGDSDAGRSRVSAGGGPSVDAYRRQHEITVIGGNVPPPYTTFDSTGFPSEILREVHHAGFSAPTPIQAQSWPVALESRDIVAVAKTGSGKTLGYLIPGFIHLKRVHNNPQMGPTILVLSPTRELATQILDEAVKFGKSSRINSVCLYGGAPKGPQLRELDRGAEVVVATPGRLNDILEMRRVSLRQVSYLVLDEADRMLDMGFEPQIRKIVKEIPSRRQTLMFTATWPKEVRKIAADLLVNPVQVNIGNIDELVANKSITQYVEVIMPSEKPRRLEQILRSQESGSKVIIFCSTKRMCDQLARNLTRQFGAAAIHGDKSQSERDSVLSQFRTGRSPVLVATDVAARGLDIKDIRVVLNYDFPTGVEDYVHRIGRTGRAGATGVAYTFFCDQDSKYASDLVKVLEGADQRVPPELRGMISRGGYGGRSRRWGSGSHDGGFSHGGHNDFSYGDRHGSGEPPYSGRFDGGHGGREQSPPRARYGWSQQGDGNADARGHCDVKDSAAISHFRVGSHSRSRSRSPNKGHGVGWGNSRSRSPNQSGTHGSDRHGGDGPAQGQPLFPKEPSPTKALSFRSPSYQEHQQQRDIGETQLDNSTSPPKEKSSSPHKYHFSEKIHGEESATADQGKWGSLHCHGDSGLTDRPVLSAPLACEEEKGITPTMEEGMSRDEAASYEPDSVN